MKVYFTFVLLLLLTINSGSARRRSIKNDDVFRLPGDVIPDNYSIVLTIDPISDIFYGHEFIYFHLAEETSTVEAIYLHADTQYININSVTLNTNTTCEFEDLPEVEIVKISCSTVPEKGSNLSIAYNGTYSEDGYGLVKSKYEEQGESQIFVNSYFEPTYTRRVFPCFDEPDFKANFKLSVVYPGEFSVLSTMPYQNSYTVGSFSNSTALYYYTLFEPTPKISPHLLSIFISKLQEVSFLSEDEEYTFKILVRPSIAQFTSKVAGAYYNSIMDTLSNFTGQSFNQLGDTECYQIAVPDCYSENMGFGLFSYREEDLLDEGELTTIEATKNIIQAMVYKLSHEWFGGEISTKWWTDVWANEALPIYLKYIIPNQIEEEFEFKNLFVVEVVQKAMQYDALPFAEPLSSNESDVNTIWDIEDKFDRHSLLKGASLLHMINHSLYDQDKFKENLQDYLQNRSYLDTDGQDVLDSIAKSDRTEDLNLYFEQWVFAAGFPLLTVTISDSTEEIEAVTVSQKRFAYPANASPTSLGDVEWTIPITAASANGYFLDTFYRPGDEFQVNVTKGDWIIFNSEGDFHYRVNYDEEVWRRLIAVLKSDNRTSFLPLTRAKVVDDIFNIARTGDVAYSLAFELAEYLVDETEYYPWYSALNAFTYLLGKMRDDYAEANLKAYILSLMENVIAIPDTGLDGNTAYIEVLKQVMILDWACKLGQEGCINFATTEFAKYKRDQTRLQDYNLRRVIFCNAIRYSQSVDEDWRFLFHIYNSTLSVHEQKDILYALGCSEDEETLRKYFTSTLSTSVIKRQDVLVVFESITSSSTGIKAAVWFLENYLDDIHSTYDGNSDEIHVFSDMVYSLAGKLVSDELLDWLDDLLSSEIFSGYDDFKTRTNTLAEINNYWAKQYQDIIERIVPVSVTTTTTTEKQTTTQITDVTEPSTGPTTTYEPGTTTDSSSSVAFLNSFIFATLMIIYSVLLNNML